MYSPLFKRYCEIGTTARRDPVYMSVLVSLLINRVQKNGKKNLAATAVYTALDLVAANTGGSSNTDQLERPRKKSNLETVSPESEGKKKKEQNEQTNDSKNEPKINSPLHYLTGAVQYVAPQIVFKSSKARFGRRTKLVPIETRSYTSIKTALSWIVADARLMSKKYPLPYRLATAILQAFLKKGPAFAKKKSLHKRGRSALQKPKKRKKPRS